MSPKAFKEDAIHRTREDFVCAALLEKSLHI